MNRSARARLARLTLIGCLLLLVASCTIAVSADTPGASDLGKPTFVVPAIAPGRPLRIVLYGDMRFTDPLNRADTNPRVRKWLANRVAQEKPDALLLTGDLPFRGDKAEDWEIYRQETEPWRGLRVYPTLGNHELVGDRDTALQHYFEDFPELKDHRWYSVQFGGIYLISLDSVDSLSKGGRQYQWLEAQLANLPSGINFVFVLSHMPMMADLQTEILVHLPDANQIRIRGLLETASRRSTAKFIVANGHIHNYERFERDGICYLISGGGGAKPYPVLVRGPEDLYRETGFPNFHYLFIEIEGKHAAGAMYRVADPTAPALTVERKDYFILDAK